MDAFKLWCWRRFLRVPWTARRSNQSILKEVNPEYSLEGLMLKLKFQYFGPPDEKSLLMRKDPDAGEDWRQKENVTAEDEMIGWDHWLHEYEFEWALGVDDGLGSLVCCSPWGCKESDMTERYIAFFFLWEKYWNSPQLKITCFFKCWLPPRTSNIIT